MDMEEGDSYAIESGTVFHYENIDEGQRFQVFSIHDLKSSSSSRSSSRKTSSYAAPHSHSEEEEGEDNDLQEQQTSFHVRIWSLSFSFKARVCSKVSFAIWF